MKCFVGKTGTLPLVLMLAGLLTAGCAFKGDPEAAVMTPRPRGPGGELMAVRQGERGTAEPLPPDVWRIEPVSMRIFPSSRLAEVDGQPVMAARVELLDAMGDSTKGVGHFRFELYEGPDLQRRLYAWDVPVRTLAQNRQFYDPITRAYLFNLFLDEPLGPDREVTLNVSFMPVRGPRLEARALFDSDTGRIIAAKGADDKVKG